MYLSIKRFFSSVWRFIFPKVRLDKRSIVSVKIRYDIHIMECLQTYFQITNPIWSKIVKGSATLKGIQGVVELTKERKVPPLHWMEFPHFRISGLCVLPLFPFFLWEVATFPFFAFYPIVANLPSVPRTSLEFSFCCYFFRPKPGTFSVQWNLPQLFFCFSSFGSIHNRHCVD